mmetsp:Transcript_36666/g.84355  ORF Transcript_36666/g.84355 Transcript_36666/m.84355 type:complete len:236 (-) Transcript_36666:281-988(-)
MDSSTASCRGGTAVSPSLYCTCCFCTTGAKLKSGCSCGTVASACASPASLASTTRLLNWLPPEACSLANASAAASDLSTSFSCFLSLATSRSWKSMASTACRLRSSFDDASSVVVAGSASCFGVTSLRTKSNRQVHRLSAASISARSCCVPVPDNCKTLFLMWSAILTPKGRSSNARCMSSGASQGSHDFNNKRCRFTQDVRTGKSCSPRLARSLTSITNTNACARRCSAAGGSS